MNNDDLKKISKKLDAIVDNLSDVKDDLKDVKTTQKEHTKELDALSGDMEQVLSELKAAHDEIGLWHQRDKREIDQIKKHLKLPLVSDIPEV